MLGFKSAAEGSWEHWEADDSNGSAASDSEENARSVQQGPGHVGAATGAESLLSAGSLASRASKMFDVGALEPQDSGLTPACGKPSKQLVQFAWRAANDSATSTGRRSPRPSATSTAWWPSGGCLETLWARRCSHARTVGIKARRAAGETTAEQAVVKRAVQRAQSKLEPDNPPRQELAAEAKEAEASLLRETVDFPALAVEQSLEPLASGSRKRKREPEPSQDQQLSILDDKVLNRRRRTSSGRSLHWNRSRRRRTRRSAGPTAC